MDSKQIILKENETIDNFKHLSINVKINSPYVFVKNIKINTPKLSKYLEKHNIVVLSDGGVDAHRGKSEQVYIYPPGSLGPWPAPRSLWAALLGATAGGTFKAVD